MNATSPAPGLQKQSVRYEMLQVGELASMPSSWSNGSAARRTTGPSRVFHLWEADKANERGRRYARSDLNDEALPAASVALTQRSDDVTTDSHAEREASPRVRNDGTPSTRFGSAIG